MPDRLIKPFKGLLYNKRRIADISSCVCPPYDIIPDPKPYYERSLYNTVRLELPIAENGLDQYETAKRTLDAWLAQDVLAFDGNESIYIYEQQFAVNGVTRTRIGIIPLVRLDRQRILTHEETRKKAREDRERLIAKLRTFTSLVFAMYGDESGEIGSLVAGSEKEQLYDFIDESAIRNRFFRMTRRNEMDILASLMEDENLYIADGHHRLSVSFKLGLPYAAIYLTDMNSDGIAILPYHRIIKLNEKKQINELLEPLRPYFTITEVRSQGSGTVSELIDRVSASRTLSFLFYFGPNAPSLLLLEQTKPIEFDSESHEILRRLRVNAIHSGVLKHLLSIKDEEISFLNEPAETMALVDKGEYDLAVFVPATSVTEVKEIADNGLYMPPKSTYFYPKVISGLVFHRYA